MKAAALIVIFAISLVFLVRHYSTNKSSPSQPHASDELPSQNSNLKALQDRLAREQARLDTLQTSLDRLNSQGEGEGENSDERVHDINARIHELEQQLSNLAQEQRAAGAAFNVEQQVQEINNAIADLQGEEEEIRNTPTIEPRVQAMQIQSLETQISNQRMARDNLLNERRSTASTTGAPPAAGAQESKQESPEILQERQKIEHELADLRNEVSSMNQGGKDAAQKAQRIQELQGEIANQQAVVDDLRNQYAQQSGEPAQ